MKLLFILLLIRLSIAQIDNGRTFSTVCASVFGPEGKFLHFLHCFVIPYCLNYVIMTSNSLTKGEDFRDHNFCLLLIVRVRCQWPIYGDHLFVFSALLCPC